MALEDLVVEYLYLLLDSCSEKVLAIGWATVYPSLALAMEMSLDPEWEYLFRL